MQSTSKENEEQQGSPEHVEHQWHMENEMIQTLYLRTIS